MNTYLTPREMEEEFIINKDKQSGEVQISPKDYNLKFRKDQNFNSDYIVACNDIYTRSYLLKRISDSKFKISDAYSNGPGLWSIATFIDGYVDVYWHNDALYNKHQTVLFELPYMVAVYLKFRYPNYRDNDLILTHLKEDIYLSVEAKQNIFLLSKQKKILFFPRTYRYNISRSWCDTIHLDNIVFKNFEVTEELLQKLRELDTIDQMKAMILSELALGVI